MDDVSRPDRDCLGDRGIDHRGAEGLLDLLADVLAHRVPELAGQRPRLPADGCEQLLPLPAQGAHLVAGEPALGRRQGLAQAEQLLDLRRPVAHQGVDEPRRQRRAAQGGDRRGAGAVAVRLGLLDLGVAGAGELLRAQAVEASGDGGQSLVVHGRHRPAIGERAHRRGSRASGEPDGRRSARAAPSRAASAAPSGRVPRARPAAGVGGRRRRPWFEGRSRAGKSRGP